MLIELVEFGLDGSGSEDFDRFSWYVDTIDIALFLPTTNNLSH